MSGLPLAELLGLPSLSRARLLAGDPWRRVGWVHVVDVPEPAAIALAVPRFLETFPEPALSVLARAGPALAFSSDAPVVREVSPLKGALAAGRPLMGRGIPLERALFYYTRPEASALPPARLWPGERADLVVFDRDPLEHPEEARVVRVEVDGVAVFTA
jgi:imidazolonepropionase-like amidohydrolase